MKKIVSKKMLFNFLSNFCTPMVGVLEYCSVIYWYCSCQSQAPISDLTYSTEDHCVTYTLSILASQVSSSFCASEGHCLKKKHPEARFWVNYCTVQTNVILHPVISKGEGGGGGGITTFGLHLLLSMNLESWLPLIFGRLRIQSFLFTCFVQQFCCSKT